MWQYESVDRGGSPWGSKKKNQGKKLFPGPPCTSDCGDNDWGKKEWGRDIYSCLHWACQSTHGFWMKKEIVLSHSLIEFKPYCLPHSSSLMGKGQIIPQNSIRLSSYCFVSFSNLWRDWDPPEKVQPPLSLLLLPHKLPKQNESAQTITWIVKTQILWLRPPSVSYFTLICI